MNAHDPDFSGKAGELALVRYGAGELTVMRPGRYVLCAVSGVKIPLDALRYWSSERQEAYAGPAEALARWRQTEER
ncbi:MAG TPA: DUF2093 domain-containing protein [Caulobacteraceae bacterium]|nr:DUF2093 domain-containing protein [Caulobacteraceae bacterium]